MESNIVPLYQQIKEDIKAAIESGRYKPKEQIPTEPELSAEYQVSRITVRRAVAELCAEGYLVKRQGRGTFVSTPRIHRKFSEGNGVKSFTKCCAESGLVAGARLLHRQIVPVRQEEQHFFGVDSEALLLYIQRLRTADGQPIFLENVFLPYDTFKELMGADLTDVSLFAVIEQMTGRICCDFNRRTIEITRATPEQAQQLGVPVGEPLFFLNAYFLDQHGQPLCIGRQYYIGSRYMFDFA